MLFGIIEARGERRHYPSTYVDMIPAPDGQDLYPQLCMRQGAWLRSALTYGELKRSAARRIWRGRDLSGGAGDARMPTHSFDSAPSPHRTPERQGDDGERRTAIPCSQRWKCRRERMALRDRCGGNTSRHTVCRQVLRTGTAPYRAPEHRYLFTALGMYRERLGVRVPVAAPPVRPLSRSKH